MMYLLTVLLGYLSWTLTEYLIHRFLGHEFKIKTIFKVEHLQHHSNKDYFAPFWKKIIASMVVALFILASLYYVLPLTYNVVFTLSYVMSYLFYEIFHAYIHVTTPRNKLGKNLRKHHFYHHFMKANMNNGVTTTFWDKIFGTYVATEIVYVHRNFAMDWLAIDEKNNSQTTIL